MAGLEDYLFSCMGQVRLTGLQVQMQSIIASPCLMAAACALLFKARKPHRSGILHICSEYIILLPNGNDIVNNGLVLLNRYSGNIPDIKIQ